jgi:hypothetical protein
MNAPNAERPASSGSAAADGAGLAPHSARDSKRHLRKVAVVKCNVNHKGRRERVAVGRILQDEQNRAYIVFDALPMPEPHRTEGYSQLRLYGVPLADGGQVPYIHGGLTVTVERWKDKDGVEQKRKITIGHVLSEDSERGPYYPILLDLIPLMAAKDGGLWCKVEE